MNLIFQWIDGKQADEKERILARSNIPINRGSAGKPDKLYNSRAPTRGKSAVLNPQAE